MVAINQANISSVPNSTLTFTLHIHKTTQQGRYTLLYMYATEDKKATFNLFKT